MSSISQRTSRKKRISVITPRRMDKDKDEVLRMCEYFDSVIAEHAPKSMPVVEKSIIDPFSPLEIKTGCIPKYGVRQLTDWSGAHNARLVAWK